MSEHSYGHGTHCYWCGADGDTEDDKPCDESVNKRPSAEAMAEVDRREGVTRQIEAFFFEYIYGVYDFDVLVEKIKTLGSRPESEDPLEELRAAGDRLDQASMALSALDADSTADDEHEAFTNLMHAIHDWRAQRTVCR